MSLFCSLFRSRQQEHEYRPPLPPRPNLIATQKKAGGSIDIPSSSVERNLEAKIEKELEIPIYDGFESLCKQFEQKLLDLQTLRSAHQEALSIIQELQSQQAQTIEERQRAIEAKQSQVRALSAQLHDATAQIQQLRGQKDQVIANLRAELRQQQESFANRDKKQRNREEKLRDEIQASSKALARANQALEEQRILCDQMAQRAEESQRLPRGILQSSFAARFVQPFVVVLIDGDAYKFTRDLTQDRLHGGARAAHRIKTEVLNYMATHAEVPLHSKVVVRIFFNAGSQRGKLGKDGLRSTPAGQTFMIRFSETHPLFDFLDCGSGKERADTKIRQNFELFIDNPYCRAMFLAVCYDGGFVRMLEPYQYSEDALNKIVLIKAGQVAPGFQSVPLFKFTEFASVFMELYSLKIGPIGRTFCGADEREAADVRLGMTLSSDDGREPEDLPIGNVPYAPWNHPRRYVRSSATLLGLDYEATLLSVARRGALRAPEVIALQNSSFQLCGPDDRPKTSPTPHKKRRKKGKI